MADSEVQLNPGTGGAEVDTSAVTTTEGTVQRQRVAIGDPATGGQLANVTAAGGLQVDASLSPSLPLPTGAAQDGDDWNIVPPNSTGWGIRGWLSGIYARLAQNLGVDIQQVANTPTATTADGTQLVSIAGPTGDPIDAIGNALGVSVENKGGVLTPGAPVPLQQTADFVAGSRLEVSFNANVLAPTAVTDCSNYRYVSVQVNLISGSPVIVPQESNDGISWTTVYLITASGTTTVTSSITASGLYAGPIKARYFRLSVTTAATNCTGVCEFFAVPPPIDAIGISGGFVNTTPNTTVAAADSLANPTVQEVLGFPTVYNGTTWDRQRSIQIAGPGGTGVPSSAIMGQFTQTGFINVWNPVYASSAYGYYPLQIDSSGNLKVTVNIPKTLYSNTAQIADHDVATTADGVQLVSLADAVGDPINSVAGAIAVAVQGLVVDAVGELLTTTGGKSAVAVAVTTAAQTVKQGAGRLCKVLVTAAGSSQALTIYDNASQASGTIIGVIPSGASAGQVYDFQMPVVNGITCSGSSSNPAVTISFI
jgi:hypothetical protein